MRFLTTALSLLLLALSLAFAQPGTAQGAYGCVAANGVWACSATGCNDPAVAACGTSCTNVNNNLCGKCQNGTNPPCGTNPGGTGTTTNPGGTGTGTNPGGATGSFQNPLAGSVDNLVDFFLRMLRIMMSILGGLSVLFIVIGGFQYVLSAGNEESAGKARKTITYAIIGLVVALLSFAIIAIVQNLLGASIQNPKDVIGT